MRCERCGAPITEGQRFCQTCGLELQQPAPQPAKSEMTQPAMKQQTPQEPVMTQPGMKREYAGAAEQKQPAKKKSRIGLWIGLAAGGAVLIAAVVLLLVLHPWTACIPAASNNSYAEIQPRATTGPAATEAPEQKSSDLGADAITFDGVQYKGDTPFVIYDGTAQKPSVTVRDRSGKVIDPSLYTVSYDGNDQPGTARVTVTLNDGSGVTGTAWFKIYLPATTETEVANADGGIRVTWNAVKGAKGYVIYRRERDTTGGEWSEYTIRDHTVGTEWTDADVLAGWFYQYGVKAYHSDPTDSYNLGEVGPQRAIVRVTTRSLLGVDAGKNEMTVRWSGSKYFTGYQIKYSTDPEFKKDVTALKITKADAYRTTINRLTSGKTYYVTIRSYHEFEGMTYFGEWSDVIACTVN